MSVFIPTSKIIAYAKSINQYPDLGSSWTTTITSQSSGVSAVITLGKIISDSTVLLTEPETAHEEMTKTEFQTALAQYKMPGIVAAYPGELGNQLEIEIVSKAAFDKGEQLTIYPSGGQRASTAKAVFGYGPQTDTQYAIIVRRDGAVVESTVLSTSRQDKDIYGNNIFMDDYFSKGSSRYIFATAQGWPEGFAGVIRLGGGVSANESVTAGDLIQGWDLFGDREALRVNLLIAGACAGETDGASYDSANMNINTTYAAIDGNYKYQYDKYNFARPNLFEVEIPYLGRNFSFKCKAAPMPAGIVEKVPVGYMNPRIEVL